MQQRRQAAAVQPLRLLGDANNSGRRLPIGSSSTMTSAAAFIKTPPPSVSSANRLSISSSASSSAASSSSASFKTTRASSSSVQKKIDDLFKRMQAHTIVQSYEKIRALLRIVPSVAVNTELLRSVSEQLSLQDRWSAQLDGAVATVAPQAMKQPRGPGKHFHYGYSIKYALSDPTLSLATVKALSIQLVSALSSTPKVVCRAKAGVIQPKLWQLVAETERSIGLALYALPVGQWNASSLVAVVWTKTKEIVHLYLQLNLAEMLYAAPERPIRVAFDDVDSFYGLHSYTASITLRSLEQFTWEREWYQVEFPAITEADKQTNTLTVQLLDETAAYRDRSRFTTGAPCLNVATDAISYAMQNAVLVDFNMWDANCTPIWSLSRPLTVVSCRTRPMHANVDISNARKDTQYLQLSFKDEARGNSLLIDAETAKSSVWCIKQISVAFSISFINATFGTNYAVIKT